MNRQIVKSFTPELNVYQLRRFSDTRGYFQEIWKDSVYKSMGIPALKQDNLSFSTRGVLRGLHYQLPSAQGKLVSVMHGQVWDVAVDIRPDSPRFKEHYGVLLSEENAYQFYIPPGFAHGFVVLSDSALFLYKCSEEYDPLGDKGIAWNDPALAIPWPLPADELIISEKDRELPTLEYADSANLPHISDSLLVQR